MFSQKAGPIGIFDSGYGGLTVFDKIRQAMPEYDYIYLGDNARTPYGPRSFEVVYRFTRQAVMKLFSEGCQLVILACNTASAKALRTIQPCVGSDSSDGGNDGSGQHYKAYRYPGDSRNNIFTFLFTGD